MNALLAESGAVLAVRTPANGLSVMSPDATALEGQRRPRILRLRELSRRLDDC